MTGRFHAALDQLDGNNPVEVRLAGIAALERIAKYSEQDYRPVMEILTAYVREHAAWKQPALSVRQEAGEGSQHSTMTRTAGATPAIDIQAVLTVLQRRDKRFGRGERQRLDLSYTDLRGAFLYRAHLEEANLVGAHLEGASLDWAHLEGANLDWAHLEGARLYRAHLEGACLYGTSLESTFLYGADLSGAFDLAAAQLASARIDEETTLPGYLT